MALRHWRWLVSRRFRDRFLSRSRVLLMALKWFSAVSRCLSTVWWYALISPSIFRRHTLPDCVDGVSVLIADLDHLVLCELSCPPGRNFWVAIGAVGCGIHFAVLGHGAAV
eukprot:scaffold252290_cov25-Attheya_sp.AAC.1